MQYILSDFFNSRFLNSPALNFLLTINLIFDLIFLKNRFNLIKSDLSSLSYTIIIVKFLYDCLKIEFKAKIKYLKFDLYGIIIVTNGTFIYMKGVNQNQLIFFFPIFEIGGVEKNFFIISDFFTKKLNNYNLSLLTSKRSHLFKKNLNKNKFNNT